MNKLPVVRQVPSKPEEADRRTFVTASGREIVLVKPGSGDHLPPKEAEYVQVQALQRRMIADAEALKAAVRETREEIAEVNRYVDGTRDDLKQQLESLKEELSHLKEGLLPVLELVAEKRETNEHLDKVLSQLEDYLNQ